MKEDEAKLFDEMRRYNLITRKDIEEICESIEMPYKRCDYLLLKWSRKGWWDYGVNQWCGWFAPEAPARSGDVP